MLVTLLAFVVCVFASCASQSWLPYLLFGVGALLTSEYLGLKLFEQEWFQRLSVEHAGFSIMRIVAGVLVVLLVAGLIILGRLLYVQVFG